MIAKPLEKLVREVVRDFTKREGGDFPKADPEQWLTALLLSIQKQIRDPQFFIEMTSSTLDRSFDDSNLEQADKLLHQHNHRKINGKVKSKTHPPAVN